MSPSYDEASVFVLSKYTIELHYFVLLRLVSDSKDSFDFDNFLIFITYWSDILVSIKVKVIFDIIL